MARTRPPVDWSERTLRSFLFAPGNHPRRLEKVGTFGSDVIVLDLEDAVAVDEKTAARAMTRDALPSYTGRTIVFVRVNGADTGRMADDIAAVACVDLDAIMVPKIESAAVLPEVDRLLGEAERAVGIEVGTIRVVGIVETALGLVRADDIAASASGRVVTLAFGAGDFSTDLGVDLTQDATELLYARSRLVVAARAVGLAAPIDGPYLDLQNFDGLVEDTKRSRQLGFQGRVIVYPPQVEHAQRTYSDLPEEDAERARRVVQAFEEAEAQGIASIQVDGRFVDYPIYYRAKHKLKLYDALRADEGGAA